MAALTVHEEMLSGQCIPEEPVIVSPLGGGAPFGDSDAFYPRGTLNFDETDLFISVWS